MPRVLSRLDLPFPPRAWSNQSIRLYHGTTMAHAGAITASGVKIEASRFKTDFGRGFYTTTLERQAHAWAWYVTRKQGGRPAVVYADVDRDELGALETLTFVRGDFDAEDYWSFVVHCRLAGADHARFSAGKRHYDLVVGPVAASWQQRSLMADYDQLSFHTPEAEQVLNRSSWRILR